MRFKDAAKTFEYFKLFVLTFSHHSYEKSVTIIRREIKSKKKSKRKNDAKLLTTTKRRYTFSRIITSASSVNSYVDALFTRVL